MCACPKPGPGFPMSYVMVYSFLCVCPKPGAWISNVTCHGLLIFVSVPSQALDFQCHMSWSTHFCICPKPGPGFPMSYVMVYSFLCVCPKPGHGFIMSWSTHFCVSVPSQGSGFPMSYVMVYSFLWACPKPGVWISNVICHGLLIFVCLSQARAWISNVMLWSTNFCVSVPSQGLDF